MSRVQVQLEGDARRLLASLDRLVNKLGEVGKEGKRAGRATREGSDDAEHGLRSLLGGFDKLILSSGKAFGPAAIAQIGAFAASFKGVEAAINVAREAFSRFQREREAAASALEDRAKASRQLLQLAGGDPERLRALNEQADTLRKQTGVDEQTARATIFNLQSAELNTADNRALVAQQVQLGMDPFTVTKSASALRTAFGTEEAGTLRQITSKALGAGQLFTVDPTALVEAASKGGAVAGVLGISDEDVISATGVAAQVTGSEREGGTKVAAFLRQLVKLGFKGKGIGEALDFVGGMTGGGPDQEKVAAASAEISKIEGQLADLDRQESRASQMSVGRGKDAKLRRQFQVEDFQRRRSELEAELAGARGKLSAERGREASGLDAAALREKLTDEGFVAFQALTRNRDLFERGVAVQLEAQQGDFVGKLLGAAPGDPFNALAEAGMQARTAAEIDRAKALGPGRALADSVATRAGEAGGIFQDAKIKALREATPDALQPALDRAIVEGFDSTGLTRTAGGALGQGFGLAGSVAGMALGQTLGVEVQGATPQERELLNQAQAQTAQLERVASTLERIEAGGGFEQDVDR